MTRPVLFLRSLALLLISCAVILGIPIVAEFAETGLVPRLPTQHPAPRHAPAECTRCASAKSRVHISTPTRPLTASTFCRRSGCAAGGAQTTNYSRPHTLTSDYAGPGQDDSPRSRGKRVPRCPIACDRSNGRRSPPFEYLPKSSSSIFQCAQPANALPAQGWYTPSFFLRKAMIGVADTLATRHQE